MTEGLGGDRKISKREREKIARELIEGYKKMAPLNRKLAKKFYLNEESEDGTN